MFGKEKFRFVKVREGDKEHDLQGEPVGASRHGTVLWPGIRPFSLGHPSSMSPHKAVTPKISLRTTRIFFHLLPPLPSWNGTVTNVSLESEVEHTVRASSLSW